MLIAFLFAVSALVGEHTHMHHNTLGLKVPELVSVCSSVCSVLLQDRSLVPVSSRISVLGSALVFLLFRSHQVKVKRCFRKPGKIR